MSFANELIEMTDINCREIEKIPQMQRMLSGDISDVQYIHFMKNLYPVVLNFCPIMAAASSRCLQSNELIRFYFYDHIHEEKGHEKIVLQDILSFGTDVDEVLHGPVTEPVQAMLAFNHHAALMGNPCSVLGMIYVLEIISSVYAGKVAHSVSKSLGRKISDGFVFLHSHSSVDVEHMAKIRQLFQTIQSPEIFSDLMNSIKMNFYLFCQILKNERQ